MKKKTFIFLMVFVGLMNVISFAQQKTNYHFDKKLLKQIDQNFKDASAQYKFLAKQIPENRFPKTFENNKLETSGSGWWCSGFYPGTLLYLNEQLNDSSLYNEANRMMQLLAKEQFNTATHDLGFMMYCSFGNENRLHPSDKNKEILLNSAKSLSTRFNPKVGCIKSWDSKPSDYLVIIDNMMNLELLFWATSVTGDSSFYKIAVTHANTTLKNHYRPDHSSFHVLNYDPLTGNVQRKRTAQGAADSSAWARGQVWGLYGYTVMYRATKDPQYLQHAQNIAQFVLSHPNLPSDKIPYWDFNAPGIPNALRDASAASIMASALLELCKYVDADKASYYITTAEQILRELSSSKYRAAYATNGGFLLEHSVGHMPEKREIDAPLSYADYYFVEAMGRYKSLAKENLLTPKTK